MRANVVHGRTSISWVNRVLSVYNGLYGNVSPESRTGSPMSFKSTPLRITAQTRGSRRFQGVRPAFIRTLVILLWNFPLKSHFADAAAAERQPATSALIESRAAMLPSITGSAPRHTRHTT